MYISIYLYINVYIFVRVYVRISFLSHIPGTSDEGTPFSMYDGYYVYVYIHMYICVYSYVYICIYNYFSMYDGLRGYAGNSQMNYVTCECVALHG